MTCQVPRRSSPDPATLVTRPAEHGRRHPPVAVGRQRGPSSFRLRQGKKPSRAGLGRLLFLEAVASTVTVRWSRKNGAFNSAIITRLINQKSEKKRIRRRINKGPEEKGYFGLLLLSGWLLPRWGYVPGPVDVDDRYVSLAVEPRHWPKCPGPPFRTCGQSWLPGLPSISVCTRSAQSLSHARTQREERGKKEKSLVAGCTRTG